MGSQCCWRRRTWVCCNVGVISKYQLRWGGHQVYDFQEPWRRRCVRTRYLYTHWKNTRGQSGLLGQPHTCFLWVLYTIEWEEAYLVIVQLGRWGNGPVWLHSRFSAAMFRSMNARWSIVISLASIWSGGHVEARFGSEDRKKDVSGNAFERCVCSRARKSILIASSISTLDNCSIRTVSAALLVVNARRKVFSSSARSREISQMFCWAWIWWSSSRTSSSEALLCSRAKLTNGRSTGSSVSCESSRLGIFGVIVGLTYARTRKLIDRWKYNISDRRYRCQM